MDPHNPRHLFLALGPARPAIERTLTQLACRHLPRRLWARDARLWSADGEVQGAIGRRLGWLDGPDFAESRRPELESFAAEIRAAGYRRVLLLGMGGSSLAPEVFARSFPPASGHPRVEVLDDTGPAAVRAARDRAPLEQTLFVVSSKSGTTTETLAFLEYFWQQRRNPAGAAGRDFVAVTDPGTPLEELARARGFRRVFLNPPDIGGRYSALSYFGLVPAALQGADLKGLADRARDLAGRCGPGAAPLRNPGVYLGAVLGTLARLGRDKLTLLFSPGLASLGTWIEQLVAESTGKAGRGIVPVDGEPLADPDAYGPDRVFVAMGLAGEPEPLAPATRRALAARGHPVICWRLRDPLELGAEFLRWEIATATAGAVLGINPFDEPNVAEAKAATRELLEQDPLPEGELDWQDAGLSIFGAPGGGADAGTLLRRFLARARPYDYLALLAYLDRTPEVEARLKALRRLLSERLGRATTLGHGPRYLHSTGQLHKGGPNHGVFLILTADGDETVPVPGQPYDFGRLKRAQALGDVQVLRRHGRRVMRVHLADAAAGLDRLLAALERAWEH